MTDELGGLWQRYEADNLERVAELTLAAEATYLDPAARASALRAAHQLAGSLGSYGFPEGTRLAREIDRVLRNDESTAQLQPLVAALSATIAGEPTLSEMPAPAVSAPIEPMLLIVEDDTGYAERIVAEAATRRLRATIASDPAASRRAIALQPPDVILLDLSFPHQSQDGLSLLSQLTRDRPDVPVLVLTGRDGLSPRVAVARHGGRAFLEKTLPIWQVLDAVVDLLHRQRARHGRVLAIDDDPQVLAQISAVLEPSGLAVTTVGDGPSFWRMLDELAPDLIVLDVNMPQLNGIELCRVVRNDPRWAGLPILFLTLRAEPALVHEMFAAGADDYVAKPIVGPELVTRITNRLERTRLLRVMAETDYLTGLANRRRSTSDLERLLRQAARAKSPLTLAVIDVNRFKGINDQFGHSMGDVVLRRIADHLRGMFRAEDVIGRWGGDEFVVGMYGMHGSDTIQRLTYMLERLAADEISTPAGDPVHMSVSVGTAQFPQDGADLRELYHAADAAMYTAKTTGLARVVTASAIE